jgi:hypothetical protein
VFPRITEARKGSGNEEIFEVAIIKWRSAIKICTFSFLYRVDKHLYARVYLLRDEMYVLWSFLRAYRGVPRDQVARQ